MNLEKHPKNLVREWLEEEENLVPAHSRSPRVLGIGKPVGSKGRPSPPPRSTPEQDPALKLREPGPPPKLEDKHSQAASFEHQQKVSRLTRLRAPHPSELRRNTPPPAPPAPRPATKATRAPRRNTRAAGKA